MAHAYTPGLTVTERTVVRKERRLPLAGDVIVAREDKVKAETIVARTNLPGNVQTINVAGRLSLPPEDIHESMAVGVGDAVKKGDIVAHTKGFFGLLKSTCRAPAEGTIESISDITGQVILREPPLPVEVAAYIDGVVTEVMEHEGAVIEALGTFVQGIFGIGGERYGTIKKVCDDPSDILTDKEIDEECRGAVLIGGALATSEAIKRAIAVGARGVVVGGMDDRDLRGFLGYDIGVAITGAEDIDVTVIVTEGFGRMSMADKTFRLLTSHEGHKASMNGATQIRAGVIRPEVIVPLDADLAAVAEKLAASGSEGLVEGSEIRVIREPYFGALGKVVALPADLARLETEAMVRVLEAELDDGRRVILPRANVEMIEG
ncbi:hypothetical protein AMJ39_09365 [candidate division TA06 bacterium DG_24]|uniref:RnfC Barrel sandwich hybrid domain-containing protein n=1 Tax=candidate division TA06 bacterium DG_24 TaxID=1703770 RepID=A0A0S7WQ67_UNCT6|nr:MAG: hypothetical protein AMJ39_09365 [candidate division TA06 bacterium DG_24]